MSDERAVAVVVVTYASEEYIESCLESVRGDAAQVVVVDNASSDRSAEIVRERFPDVELVENGENRGFGAGANQGAALVRTPFFCVLNPDARLEPGALAAVVDHMAAHPDVALASPELRDESGARQTTAAREPRLRDLATLVVPKLGAVNRSFRHGGYRPQLYERGEPFDAETVLGACMVFRTDAFRAAGGFDQEFFLYMEEIDLCRRLRAQGLRVVVVPRAVARHVGSASAAAPEMRGRALYEAVRSSVLFFRKHRAPAWQAVARTLGVLMVARLALRAAVGWVREPHEREAWGAKLRQTPALAGLYLGIERSNR